MKDYRYADRWIRYSPEEKLWFAYDDDDKKIPEIEGSMGVRRIYDQLKNLKINGLGPWRKT